LNRNERKEEEMSKKSQKKLLEEWEALLAGLRATAPHGGTVAFIQALLTEALREAREVRKRQEQHRAIERDASKRLHQILDRGHDTAMRARNYLRFKLGPYNDELTRYGIAPIRRGCNCRKAGDAAS
jgi:hypothetical protein